MSTSPELADEANFGGSRRLIRDAALAFDVQLSQQEYYEWRCLIGGACIVDHLVDVDRVDIVPNIEEILSGKFREDLSTKMQALVYDYWLQLPPERKDALITDIDKVGKLAEAQRTATNIHDLVEIRLEEALILRNLLSLEATERTDSQPRQQFNEWLLGWARAGYLADSFLDIARDYENGESGVVPTPTARTILAGAFTKEAIAASRKTPLSLLNKCAVNGVRYALLNKKLSATT